ncbi:MAG: hypothetical protein GEU26_17605 [Nitrososphaeraceae archaeon]|nr:hypothetical protein [Nitrososphaeraceae archaeon]
MSWGQQSQVSVVLLKESATETKKKDTQNKDKNMETVKIMLEIPKFSLDPQRHDIKEVNLSEPYRDRGQNIADND